MKILIVSTVAFQLNGITSVIMNYFRNMNKDDLQMDFLIMDEIYKSYRSELEKEGANIYYLPRKANPMKYMFGLNALLKKNKYDIMHIHGNSATITIELLVARWNKVPVRIAHSHSTACSHMMIHKMLYPLFTRTYTHAIACGEAAGHWLFRNRSFEILKNGIDLKKFFYNENVRSEYRNRLKIRDDEILIGHIGNFVTEKNHGFLLDVFGELRKRNAKYKLLLIGEGPFLEDVKKSILQLGIQDSVIMLGKTREVDKYYQAMDVFVLPSLREAMPVVLVEAQASGVPCVVSNTVSQESNLSGEVKYVSIENCDKWADVVEMVVMENSNDREKICLEWQAKITEAGYNIAINANHMKELYQKYLRK